MIPCLPLARGRLKSAVGAHLDYEFPVSRERDDKAYLTYLRRLYLDGTYDDPSSRTVDLLTYELDRDGKSETYEVSSHEDRRMLEEVDRQEWYDEKLIS